MQNLLQSIATEDFLNQIFFNNVMNEIENVVQQYLLVYGTA